MPPGVASMEVMGGHVESGWDVDPDGDSTLFEFRGELRDSAVRGSLTHEGRMTRMLRAIGVTDIEIGHQAFDDRFCVKAEFDVPMRRWLKATGVADRLLELDSVGGCTVRADRHRLVIRGEQAAHLPAPNPVMVDAASFVYSVLRQLEG
jgi:hypothetical protein